MKCLYSKIAPFHSIPFNLYKNLLSIHANRIILSCHFRDRFKLKPTTETKMLIKFSVSI